jgi:hypothetical protein
MKAKIGRDSSRKEETTVEKDKTRGITRDTSRINKHK